jgi:hypothetical protein
MRKRFSPGIFLLWMQGYLFPTSIGSDWVMSKQGKDEKMKRTQHLGVLKVPLSLMYNSLKRYLLQLCLVGFLDLGCAESAFAEGFSIVLERKPHRITLVGVVHSADASREFVEVIKRHLKSSQTVYFEADV